LEDNLAEVDGVLHVTYTARLRPRKVAGGGIARVSTTQLKVLRDGGWKAAANGAVFATGLGSVRAQLFARGRDACVAFDAIASVTKPSELRIRCAVGSRWRDAAPPITARAQGANTRALDVDGAVAVDGAVFLGIDRFKAPAQATARQDVDWPIVALGDDGRWRSTGLGSADPAWSGQGKLYALGDRVVAMRFDQVPRSGTFAARLVVDALRPATGVDQPLGPPLIDDELIYSPLQYDLAIANGRAYVVWSRPDQASRTMRLVVSAIDVGT
jgi:hypothetical protein